MNETIKLTARQKEILNIISQGENITRSVISTKLPEFLKASKSTIARDLKVLIDANLIESVGKGPATVYKPITKHPLLSYIDLNQYFSKEPDERTDAKTSFDDSVFELLPGIITQEEKKELSKIYRSFGDIEKRVDKTIFKKELERYMIELSWKSSKIEGNTYTLLETESLIKEGIEAKGKTKEEAIMILNHKEAFKLILENRKDFKKLTKRSILELHNILVRNLSITTGISKYAVGITGTVYRPSENEWEIKDAFEKMIDLVNEVDYPLEKAIDILALISYIQPFADGNKRTSRMVANAILIAHDYFPLSYRSIDENEFKQALILFYETNNVYHIKRLFLEQYKFAVKTYFPDK